MRACSFINSGQSGRSSISRRDAFHTPAKMHLIRSARNGFDVRARFSKFKGGRSENICIYAVSLMDTKNSHCMRGTSLFATSNGSHNRSPASRIQSHQNGAHKSEYLEAYVAYPSDPQPFHAAAFSLTS